MWGATGAYRRSKGCKVINVYTDAGAGKQDITVNFKNCTVNNTSSNKAVLNINDSNMGDYKYILHTYASILDRVRQSDTMRAQWMKYQTDFDYAAGITWDTVLDTVETLCMKTLDDHAFGDELPQEESQFEMHLL